MKKLYLFLLALLTCSAIASAADWDIVLNVTEGADLVEAKMGDGYDKATPYTLKNGENPITIPEGNYLYVTPNDASYNFSFKDANGKDMPKPLFGGNYYYIYANKNDQPANPYTLTVVDPNAKEEVQGWNVVINVEGAEYVTAGITAGYFQAVTEISLKDGENTIPIPEDQYLSVTPKGDANVTFTDNKGSSVAANMMNNKAFMLWANPNSEPANPYTLTAKDPSSERTQSVNVTIDEPSLVTIKLNGKNGVTAQEIKPTANSVEIPFNPETEQELAISHSQWGKIYDVIVDGKSAPKPTTSTYYIKLVNTDGDETAYVKNIDIKVNFPEDLTFKTTFTLDGPEEMISSIKVDGTEVEDIAASLKNGIETAPLSSIKISFNEEYTVESLSDNGVPPYYLGTSYEISKIDCDHNIIIKGKAPKKYDVVFNVTGAEGLVAKYRSSGETLELTEGKNTVSISEKDNKLKFLVKNGQYEFKSFADNNGYSYPNDYTLEYDGSIWVNAEEGDELTIVVDKIKRDNKLVLFYDDFTDRKADPMFFGATFAKYTDLPNELKPGYNIIEFRAEDGALSVNSMCNYTKLYTYKNGDVIATLYGGSKFEDNEVADGNVYKVFFDNEPVKHTVTFEIEDGILDGYEVKKDILTDVDVTAPVEALGLTRFTISPAAVSRAAAEGFTVKVGDEEIEPENGIYTFETTADTKVVVKAPEEEIEGYQIILNVTGADRVKAYIGEKFSTDLPEKKLVEGENKVTVPYEESLFIKAINPNDYVTFIDCDEDKVSKINGYYELYESLAKYSPYELTVADESTYRKNSVTVTMDDPEKVVIGRADGTKFEPTEKTIQILYNEENEARLTISSRDNSVFYKVTADGKDIQASYKTYSINLVDKSGDEPVYVQNIDVKANFDEGMTFKTVITLEEGSEEMISYIKINDVAVDDIKTYLSPEGFEAKPLSTIAIGFSSDYKVDEVVDNGVKKYPYSQYTIEDIDRNHDISIKGHKYAIYNVKFNITGADGIVASLGSSTIPFVEGTQEIKFSEKNNYVTFSQADGWEIETFLWGEDYDMLDSGDWRYYGKVYINAEEGDEYTIVANKIKREDQISVYFDDYDAKGITFSYFKCEFENYEAPTANIKPGYNSINFRKQDGYFKVVADKSYFCEVPYTELVVYKNSEKQTPEDKYYHDEEVANGDVYKFFFNDDPGVHNVTFDVEDGVLDGYEVKKDVIADVADFSEAVKAVGPTKFTIAPVSRTAAEGFTVKVGEEEIAAVDGVYTFETTADTKVEIKAAAPKTFEVVFNITGAEGLVATYASTGEKIEFEEGENTIDVPENDTEIIFALADKEQYKWVTFTDGEYDGLDYMENNVIDWNIDKGVEYTIVIEKIQRDNKLVIFYDEFTNPDSAFGPKFSKYTIPNEIKPGYNVVEFADEDGSLSVNLIDAGTVYPYKNDEKTGLKPLTSLYEDADVADGNVYKFFFNTDPGVHNVTFNVEDGILDGYEVKKDIIADVDATTPVKAVGPTRFTIAPVSRAAEGFFVKVGGKAIEPVDGVYTFTTTADTTVDITSKTSGIDEILMNANGPVDVFNLQGIRVLHDADADDIKALTPGFYIINGTKVLVK